MSDDLKTLYNETIRLHNDRPFHFQKKGETSTVRAYNPVCGDRFDFYIKHEDKRIVEIHFHGFGCAISKASASMLSQWLTGLDDAKAITLCMQFLDFLESNSDKPQVTLPEELHAFGPVHNFPERHDCVSQAWKELLIYLESKEK